MRVVGSSAFSRMARLRLQSGLGLMMAAPALVEDGKVARRGSHIRVDGSKSFLSNSQTALEKSLGFSVAGLASVQLGQVVYRCPYVRVIRS